MSDLAQRLGIAASRGPVDRAVARFVAAREPNGGNGHHAREAHEGVASTLVVTGTDTLGGVRLAAAGEIDQTSAPILATQLHRAIVGGEGVIVVDLGDVTFMDSSGVHALVTAHQSARTRLRLGTLHPAVRRVLEITALLEVFALADELTPP